MILKLISYRLRGALDTINNNNNIILSCQNMLYIHINMSYYLIRRVLAIVSLTSMRAI